MITFLLGLPGSGKSYYAVDRIYNNFSNDKEAKKDKKVSFKNCYTNINEFKLDKVENVYKLEFETLYEILSRMHKKSLGKNKKSDKYFLKYCRRTKILDTLFVIDEAHNNFDSKDRVLVWWLSYHRHLNHEIILITQSLGLIEAKYKQFSEFFYVAKPQSLRLFSSTFKYNRFTHSRMAKASSVGAIKIKQNKKVFELYHSGDSVDTPNMILKYLLISFFLFLGIIAFFYFFISPPAPEPELTPGEIKNKSIPGETNLENSTNMTQGNLPHTSVTHLYKKNEKEKKDKLSNNKYADNTYLRLSCTKHKCNDEVISIPPQLLKIFIDKKDMIILYAEVINQNLTIYHINTKTEFYNYIKPKKIRTKDDFNNKKDNKNKPLTSGLPFGSPSK